MELLRSNKQKRLLCQTGSSLHCGATSLEQGGQLVIGVAAFQGQVPLPQSAGEGPACSQQKGTCWQELSPSVVPHSWRFPLLHKAYVTVSEAAEGSLQVAVLIWQCLLSSLMLSGRICWALLPERPGVHALLHTHAGLPRWDLRANRRQGCGRRPD